MSITNRLKFWRTSAAKTVGVTAALAVFGSVLVASPASAVDDRITVDYWVNGTDSATVCVALNGDDELAYYPDGDGGFTTTDVTEALTIDEDNSGDLAEATIEYLGDGECGDWAFAITDIYVGDWNEVNFRFDAWVTDGDNDVWAEGSTANHRIYQSFVDNPDWLYYVDTTDISEESYSYVGLAHNNDYITDERHAAYYCLENDYSDDGSTYDYYDDVYDYIYYSEDVVGDPIVYVYDLTVGEFVAATNQDFGTDVEITDVDDEELDWQHCEGADREFWIEGLTLGHTYEFQSQYEVENYMYYSEWGSGWQAWDYEYTLGFDRSVNFTPLDIRQNLVGILPSDNDGYDGEYEGDENWEYLDSYSGWYYNYWFIGDSESWDNDQLTNVDVLLPQMQGYISADYDGAPVDGDSIDDKWYVDNQWSGKAWWSYIYADAWLNVYDGNDWLYDSDYQSTCEVNGADVNGYEEQFTDDWDNDAGAGTCNWWWGWGAYGDRGNYDWQDGGQWGHLRNFEGQAFVTMHNWDNASDDDANYYQDSDDVLEGMSNSYSSNWDFSMQSDYVRATGSDSIQLAVAMGTGEDWDCGSGDVEESVNIGDSDAVFHIRLLPNYGQDAYYDSGDGYQNGTSEDGHDNYLGNEAYPEDRLYAIDYTFEPGDYWYDGYSVWTCGGDDRDVAVFDLESYDQDGDGELEPWETLQPGTTYSVQVMAEFNTLDDDSNDDQWGDGGYETVNFGRFKNSYATTYLESHVDVTGETSAKFEVNLQDSHYTDRLNLDQAGYLAWVECADEVEYVDCSQYKTGFESGQDVNIGDINRVTISSDASVEFIDGDKHIVFTRDDLTAGTNYEVVFGMDYWQTVDHTDSNSQGSLRLEMEDTLDYSNCDYDAFWAFADDTNGTDCYNGTRENDLFRTDAVQFRTLSAPELDAVTTVDNDAAQDGTDTNTSITLEFSENVTAGSGLIQIVRASDDKVVQTIRPSASQNVAIDGNVVTITPGKTFDYGTSYYVYVAEGAFVNEDGVDFAGNDNDVTVFTTEEAPELLGTVDVALGDNFKRTVTVNLKKAVAFETVQIWWHEHHSAKLFYAGSITLDENGDGDFTRVLPRLGKYDNVIVTLGRHTVARQIVATS